MDCKFLLLLAGSSQKDLFHFQIYHVVLCSRSFIPAFFPFKCKLAFKFLIFFFESCHFS